MLTRSKQVILMLPISIEKTVGKAGVLGRSLVFVALGVFNSSRLETVVLKATG